jgi:tetrahydrodipicolinate N-succinyltransferase
VAVWVGVKVAVWVGVKVGVEVEVEVVVTVGVAVAADTVCRFPATGPPERIAAWPVVCPLAAIPVVARLFEKFFPARPDIFRSNTNRKV